MNDGKGGGLNGKRFLEIASETENGLMETIKQKAQPYFECGYRAVIEKHTLRDFDEAADIIKSDLLEHGFDEWWSESLACVFARSYIAGIAAATCLEVSA